MRMWELYSCSKSLLVCLTIIGRKVQVWIVLQFSLILTFVDSVGKCLVEYAKLEINQIDTVLFTWEIQFRRNHRTNRTDKLIRSSHTRSIECRRNSTHTRDNPKDDQDWIFPFLETLFTLYSRSFLLSATVLPPRPKSSTTIWSPFSTTTDYRITFAFPIVRHCLCVCFLPFCRHSSSFFSLLPRGVLSPPAQRRSVNNRPPSFFSQAKSVFLTTVTETASDCGP